MENNHDYRKSRATLTGIAAKSWRFSVSAFFRRKKPEVVNTVSEQRATGCEELDAELRELGMDKIEAQIAEDRISRILSILIDAPWAFPDIISSIRTSGRSGACYCLGACWM